MTKERKSARSGAFLLGVLGLCGAVTVGTRTAAATSPAGVGAEARRPVEAGVAGAEARDAALRAYGSLPLRFEQNAGQTDPRVRFLSRATGHTLFLTEDEAVLNLRAASGTDAATLRLSFEGAAKPASVKGQDPFATRTNYFQGNVSSRWQRNLVNYGQVRYDELYPGIDLVFYGNQRAFEYDLLVEPGADPEAIRLAFRGAERAEIDGRGDLVLHTAAGPIRQERPVIYQEIDGKRRPVSGRYEIVSAADVTRVAIRLGAYDPSRRLVIDPKVLTYSTYLGGSFDDEALGVAVDDFGNTYITGRTVSPDFPQAGTYQSALSGGEDVFVAKLNAAGCDLFFTTYLGGAQPGGKAHDCGNSIAVDADGNIYVGGRTGSSDFPTTVGVHRTTAFGGGDAFISKLNPAGDVLMFSSYVGGSGTLTDEIRSLTVDEDGNVYVVGSTNSRDLPTTANAFQREYGGGSSDAFVAKFAPDASTILYCTYLGGGPTLNKTQGDDFGHAIAVDADGYAYVTGTTNAFDFPRLVPFQSGINSFDAFITKINPDGSGLVFSSFLGGDGPDAGNGIALDENRNIYIAGTTGALSIPSVPGGTTGFLGGDTDAFAAKITASGRAVAYFKRIGGRGADSGRGIALDSVGNAYVVGSLNYPNLSKRDRGFRSARAGDAFVTQLSPTGRTIRFVLLSGGRDQLHLGDDSGNAVAVDPYDNAYVAGMTDSADFPVGVVAGVDQVNIRGRDGFVAKIASQPGARINVTPRRIRFRSFSGAPVTRNVMIRNTGRKPVAVTLGPLTTPPFILGTAERELVVQPGQVRAVPVTFARKSLPGTRFADVLTVVSTASNRKACAKINLTGEVR